MSQETAIERAELPQITREEMITVLENVGIKASQENMARLDNELRNRNWMRWGNEYNANGLSISTIKAVSAELRAHVTAGAVIARLAELRGAYFYGDGVGFNNLGSASAAFNDRHNMRRLFSPRGLAEINRAHATDGNVVLLIGPKPARRGAARRFSLPAFTEISSPFVNPDDVAEVWFVRRTYTRRTVTSPTPVKIDVFYPTINVPDDLRREAPKSITVEGGETVPIKWETDAVLWSVNTQTGHPLGTPDLLASLQWAEKYGGFLKNQDRFAEAVASIAWHFKSQNAEAVKSIAATVADNLGGIGRSLSTSDNVQAAKLGGASDVNFSNGEPMAALAAAAAGMTVDELLANGGDAAAKQVDPQVKRIVRLRRSEAATFFQEIAAVLGANKLEVIWPDMDDETPFREAQMIVSAWGTGLYSSEEVRVPLARKLRMPLADGTQAPEGVLIPNNERTIKLSKPEPSGGDGTDGQGGQNGQGKDTQGVGKLSDGDNTARDQGEYS